MARIEKYQWLMQMALLTAKRSTCYRIQVGAIIEKDGRIISTGYNGSVPGAQHCDEYFRNHDKSEPNFKRRHHAWALKNEIHAEANAILFAAKHGIEISGSRIWTTHMPCIVCAKYIIQVGIKSVIYLNDYDGETGEDILFANAMEVIKI